MEHMVPKEKGSDPCVLCGVDTGIPIETHIDGRSCYVEGVGQLCADCWQRLFYYPLGEETVTNLETKI